MALRFRLVPVDEEFFRLFSESARNVAETARRLTELIENPNDIDEHHSRVVECERRGDEIVRALLHRLSTSFVTPFDREDIHALAEELDDVVDDILAVADLLKLVGVEEILPELKEQGDVLVRMAEHCVELIDRLESMRGVQEHLDAIDRLESEGDAVHRRTIVRLFSGELETLEVLKWKDIVSAMEAALNTLEDISDVVESIVLKHA
jgi:predicted phosphate transport protein (TIGR00153 family)